MTTVDTVPSAIGLGFRRIAAPLLVGLPILLLVLFALGGLRQSEIPGLPVVPWSTLWSLPIDLWIRDLATAVTVGAALVGGVLSPRPDPWLGRVASLAAVVWLASIVVQAVLTVSEVLALPVGEAMNPTIVWSLLGQTTLGRTLLAQMVLVALVALLAWVVLDRVTGWIVLTGAAVAAFLPGLTGHSGIAEGHVAATVSLGVHIVAATTWIGALVATVCVLARRTPNAEIILRRFSAIALGCVIAVAETGLLNASLRVDGPAALLASQYGAIVLAKVTVLIVLIGFGWRHRQAMAGRLDGGRVAVIVVAAWEIAWMGAVLGLSVALSRTAPPAAAAAGDVIASGTLIMLGVCAPLAAIWAMSRSVRRTRLSATPELAAVLLVLGMALVGTLSATALSPQGVAVIALVVPPILGWMFWSATLASRSVVGPVVVIVALPALAWWVERDVPGGLGAGTWLTVALGIGVLMGAAAIARRDEELAVLT